MNKLVGAAVAAVCAGAAVATAVGVLAVFWVVFGEKLFGLPR